MTIASDSISDHLPQSLPEVGEDLLLGIPQVCFKPIQGGLNLWLPPEAEILAEDGSIYQPWTWQDLVEQLQQKLLAQSEILVPKSLIYLQVGDRLLDIRQIQELWELLESHALVLHSVTTTRRQTAIAAVSYGLNVEQKTIEAPIPHAPEDALYIKMTVRSGVEIRHNGSVIIFGDVNAGGEVIATGDILVWGKLKGIAHAGVRGNAQAIIMALHLEATQLRIADFVARVDRPQTSFLPEVAHVTRKGTPSICISSAASFSAQR